MDDPGWAEIVRVMYREEPPLLMVENRGERELFTTEWLAENSSLTKDQVDRTTARMKQWGLVTKQSMSIEGMEQTSTEVQFSKDGFEVAHERELNRRNTNINYSLVILTVFLVLSQIVGFLPVADLYKTAMGGVMLVVLFLLIWLAGLLDR